MQQAVRLAAAVWLTLMIVLDRPLTRPTKKNTPAIYLGGYGGRGVNGPRNPPTGTQHNPPGKRFAVLALQKRSALR